MSLWIDRKAASRIQTLKDAKICIPDWQLKGTVLAQNEAVASGIVVRTPLKTRSIRVFVKQILEGSCLKVVPCSKQHV